MNSFDKNVFINCPFDEDYRELLISLVFTTMYLGLVPRLSLERFDSGETRISKILKLICESRFGIHDLSRIVSSGNDEHFRMNMPFELGIDYGCQKLLKGQWETKRILIIEKEKYRYQAALSDLSGSDIKHHGNEAIKLVKVVRDWFICEVFGTGPSHKRIWYAYNDFMAELADNLESHGYEPEDLGEAPVSEIMSYMKEWLDKHNQQNAADPPVSGAPQVSGVGSKIVPSRVVR
jgi:hypothetical protein